MAQGTPRVIDADVVVVGAGITGVATARALARAGRGVILIEQFGLGHTQGSSHGASRIFRLSYPETHFIRMAQDALLGWRELEAECGEQLIVPNGGLDFGSVALENAPALAACGVPHELLTGAEVAERWPISAEQHEHVLFQADGGTILSSLAHSVMLAAAVDSGTAVLEHQCVTEIEQGPSSVWIRTEGEEITARACVVAAGAWAGLLLRKAGIELAVTPTRETITYFELPDALALPTIIDDALPDAKEHGLLRQGQINYSLAAPGVGLKTGIHHAGPVTAADEPGIPDPAILRWMAIWAARRYPELDPEPIGSETCLYTNTPDESFVLERHGRVVVASACSGHGFKFAPYLGREIAALADDADAA